MPKREHHDRHGRRGRRRNRHDGRRPLAGRRARRAQRPEDGGLRPADPGRRVLLRRPPQRRPDLRIRRRRGRPRRLQLGRLRPLQGRVHAREERRRPLRTRPIPSPARPRTSASARTRSGSSCRSGSCPRIRARRDRRTSSASAFSRPSSACPRTRSAARSSPASAGRRRPSAKAPSRRSKPASSSARRSPRCRSAQLGFTPGPAKLIMSGNEATAIGALHAGCRYFAGYPITPSTEILMFLDEWLPKMGGSLVQTEDELSAIGAVLGASFAGQKAMTATSGPGLSLMTEMLGLASMAELPCVVVNVQRGGPSTGLPTKSEQSDLFQAVFAGHGDMPRVVLACSDVEDSFHTTVDAFNIAEEYQIPVIVLSDQLVAGAAGDLRPGVPRPRRARAAPPVRRGADRLPPLQGDARRRLADGAPGHQGRDLPDERPRARRGGQPRLRVPPPREDEREALPQAPPHPRRPHVPPALRPGGRGRRHPVLGLVEGRRARGRAARERARRRRSPPSCRR